MTRNFQCIVNHWESCHSNLIQFREKTRCAWKIHWSPSGKILRVSGTSKWQEHPYKSEILKATMPGHTYAIQFIVCVWETLSMSLEERAWWCGKLTLRKAVNDGCMLPRDIHIVACTIMMTLMTADVLIVSRPVWPIWLRWCLLWCSQHGSAGTMHFHWSEFLLCRVKMSGLTQQKGLC